MNSFNIYNQLKEVGTIIVPILQIMKLRPESILIINS